MVAISSERFRHGTQHAIHHAVEKKRSRRRGGHGHEAGGHGAGHGGHISPDHIRSVLEEKQIVEEQLLSNPALLNDIAHHANQVGLNEESLGAVVAEIERHFSLKANVIVRSEHNQAKEAAGWNLKKQAILRSQEMLETFGLGLAEQVKHKKSQLYHEPTRDSHGHDIAFGYFLDVAKAAIDRQAMKERLHHYAELGGPDLHHAVEELQHGGKDLTEFMADRRLTAAIDRIVAAIEIGDTFELDPVVGTGHGHGHGEVIDTTDPNVKTAIKNHMRFRLRSEIASLAQTEQLELISSDMYRHEDGKSLSEKARAVLLNGTTAGMVTRTGTRILVGGALTLVGGSTIATGLAIGFAGGMAAGAAREYFNRAERRKQRRMDAAVGLGPDGVVRDASHINRSLADRVEQLEQRAASGTIDQDTIESVYAEIADVQARLLKTRLGEADNQPGMFGKAANGERQVRQDYISFGLVNRFQAQTDLMHNLERAILAIDKVLAERPDAAALRHTFQELSHDAKQRLDRNDETKEAFLKKSEGRILLRSMFVSGAFGGLGSMVMQGLEHFGKLPSWMTPEKGVLSSHAEATVGEHSVSVAVTPDGQVQVSDAAGQIVSTHELPVGTHTDAIVATAETTPTGAAVHLTDTTTGATHELRVEPALVRPAAGELASTVDAAQVNLSKDVAFPLTTNQGEFVMVTDQTGDLQLLQVAENGTRVPVGDRLALFSETVRAQADQLSIDPTQLHVETTGDGVVTITAPADNSVIAHFQVTSEGFQPVTAEAAASETVASANVAEHMWQQPNVKVLLEKMGLKPEAVTVNPDGTVAIDASAIKDTYLGATEGWRQKRLELLLQAINQGKVTPDTDPVVLMGRLEQATRNMIHPNGPKWDATKALEAAFAKSDEAIRRVELAYVQGNHDVVMHQRWIQLAQELKGLRPAPAVLPTETVGSEAVAAMVTPLQLNQLLEHLPQTPGALMAEHVFDPGSFENVQVMKAGMIPDEVLLPLLTATPGALAESFLTSSRMARSIKDWDDVRGDQSIRNDGWTNEAVPSTDVADPREIGAAQTAFDAFNAEATPHLTELRRLRTLLEAAWRSNTVNDTVRQNERLFKTSAQGVFDALDSDGVRNTPRDARLLNGHFFLDDVRLVNHELQTACAAFDGALLERVDRSVSGLTPESNTLYALAETTLRPDQIDTTTLDTITNQLLNPAQQLNQRAALLVGDATLMMEQPRGGAVPLDRLRVAENLHASIERTQLWVSRELALRTDIAPLLRDAQRAWLRAPEGATEARRFETDLKTRLATAYGEHRANPAGDFIPTIEYYGQLVDRQTLQRLQRITTEGRPVFTEISERIDDVRTNLALPDNEATRIRTDFDRTIAPLRLALTTDRAAILGTPCMLPRNEYLAATTAAADLLAEIQTADTALTETLADRQRIQVTRREVNTRTSREFIETFESALATQAADQLGRSLRTGEVRSFYETLYSQIQEFNRNHTVVGGEDFLRQVGLIGDRNHIDRTRAGQVFDRLFRRQPNIFELPATPPLVEAQRQVGELLSQQFVDRLDRAIRNHGVVHPPFTPDQQLQFYQEALTQTRAYVRAHRGADIGEPLLRELGLVGNNNQWMGERGREVFARLFAHEADIFAMPEPEQPSAARERIVRAATAQFVSRLDAAITGREIGRDSNFTPVEREAIYALVADQIRDYFASHRGLEPGEAFLRDVGLLEGNNWRVPRGREVFERVLNGDADIFAAPAAGAARPDARRRGPDVPTTPDADPAVTTIAEQLQETRQRLGRLLGRQFVETLNRYIEDTRVVVGASLSDEEELAIARFAGDQAIAFADAHGEAITNKKQREAFFRAVGLIHASADVVERRESDIFGRLINRVEPAFEVVAADPVATTAEKIEQRLRALEALIGRDLLNVFTLAVDDIIATWTPVALPDDFLIILDQLQADLAALPTTGHAALTPDTAEAFAREIGILGARDNNMNLVRAREIINRVIDRDVPPFRVEGDPATTAAELERRRVAIGNLFGEPFRDAVVTIVAELNPDIAQQGKALDRVLGNWRRLSRQPEHAYLDRITESDRRLAQIGLVADATNADVRALLQRALNNERDLIRLVPNTPERAQYVVEQKYRPIGDHFKLDATFAAEFLSTIQRPIGEPQRWMDTMERWVEALNYVIKRPNLTELRAARGAEFLSRLGLVDPATGNVSRDNLVAMFDRLATSLTDVFVLDTATQAAVARDQEVWRDAWNAFGRPLRRAIREELMHRYPAINGMELTDAMEHLLNSYTAEVAQAPRDQLAGRSLQDVILADDPTTHDAVAALLCEIAANTPVGEMLTVEKAEDLMRETLTPVQRQFELPAEFQVFLIRAFRGASGGNLDEQVQGMRRWVSALRNMTRQSEFAQVAAARGYEFLAMLQLAIINETDAGDRELDLNQMRASAQRALENSRQIFELTPDAQKVVEQNRETLGVFIHQFGKPLLQELRRVFNVQATLSELEQVAALGYIAQEWSGRMTERLSEFSNTKLSDVLANNNSNDIRQLAELLYQSVAQPSRSEEASVTVEAELVGDPNVPKSKGPRLDHPEPVENATFNQAVREAHGRWFETVATPLKNIEDQLEQWQNRWTDTSTTDAMRAEERQVKQTLASVVDAAEAISRTVDQAMAEQPFGSRTRKVTLNERLRRDGARYIALAEQLNRGLGHRLELILRSGHEQIPQKGDQLGLGDLRGRLATVEAILAGSIPDLEILQSNPALPEVIQRVEGSITGLTRKKGILEDRITRLEAYSVNEDQRVEQRLAAIVKAINGIFGTRDLGPLITEEVAQRYANPADQLQIYDRLLKAKAIDPRLADLRWKNLGEAIGIDYASDADMARRERLGVLFERALQNEVDLYRPSDVPASADTTQVARQEILTKVLDNISTWFTPTGAQALMREIVIAIAPEQHTTVAQALEGITTELLNQARTALNATPDVKPTLAALRQAIIEQTGLRESASHFNAERVAIAIQHLAEGKRTPAEVFVYPEPTPGPIAPTSQLGDFPKVTAPQPPRAEQQPAPAQTEGAFNALEAGLKAMEQQKRVFDANLAAALPDQPALVAALRERILPADHKKAGENLVTLGEALTPDHHAGQTITETLQQLGLVGATGEPDLALVDVLVTKLVSKPKFVNVGNILRGVIEAVAARPVVTEVPQEVAPTLQAAIEPSEAASPAEVMIDADIAIQELVGKAVLDLMIATIKKRTEDPVSQAKLLEAVADGVRQDLASLPEAATLSTKKARAAALGFQTDSRLNKARIVEFVGEFELASELVEPEVAPTPAPVEPQPDPAAELAAQKEALRVERANWKPMGDEGNAIVDWIDDTETLNALRTELQAANRFNRQIIKKFKEALRDDKRVQNVRGVALVADYLGKPAVRAALIERLGNAKIKPAQLFELPKDSATASPDDAPTQ